MGNIRWGPPRDSRPALLKSARQGQALQNEIVDIAHTYNMPLVGPNCLGIIRPSVGLNATFAKSHAARAMLRW